MSFSPNKNTQELSNEVKSRYQVIVKSLDSYFKQLNVSHEGSYNKITVGFVENPDAEDYFEISHPIPVVDLMSQDELECDTICWGCRETSMLSDNIDTCKCVDKDWSLITIK